MSLESFRDAPANLLQPLVDAATAIPPADVARVGILHRATEQTTRERTRGEYAVVTLAGRRYVLAPYEDGRPGLRCVPAAFGGAR